jgi:hypothetical protein
MAIKKTSRKSGRFEVYNLIPYPSISYVKNTYFSKDIRIYGYV